MLAEVLDIFGSDFFAIPEPLLSIIGRIFEQFVIIKFHIVPSIHY